MQRDFINNKQNFDSEQEYVIAQEILIAGDEAHKRGGLGIEGIKHRQLQEYIRQKGVSEYDSDEFYFVRNKMQI